MQKNELMLKRIEKQTEYFDDVYKNKDKYKTEWAFKDAQKRLDEFVGEFKVSGCCCANTEKKLNKKAKRSMIIQRIFSKMKVLITAVETIISALFVLIVSEVSHSAAGMIESHTLSLYFLGAFAVLKVLFENNLIRPVFESLGWNMYRYSYQTLYSIANSGVMQNVSEQQADVQGAVPVMEELEVSFG